LLPNVTNPWSSIMKKLCLAAAVLAATATGALAQGVYIGDRGVGIDIGGPRRDYDRRLERRDRDVYDTGSTCRTVTTTSEDDYGNVRRRQVRRCD
jgi:hypothetical protein